MNVILTSNFLSVLMVNYTLRTRVNSGFQFWRLEALQLHEKKTCKLISEWLHVVHLRNEISEHARAQDSTHVSFPISATFSKSRWVKNSCVLSRRGERIRRSQSSKTLKHVFTDSCILHVSVSTFTYETSRREIWYRRITELTQFPFASTVIHTRVVYNMAYILLVLGQDGQMSDSRFAPNALTIGHSKNLPESALDPKLDWTGEYRGRKSFRVRGGPSRNAKLPSGPSAVHRWTWSGWLSLVRAPKWGWTSVSNAP